MKKKIIVFGGHTTKKPGCFRNGISEVAYNWQMAKLVVNGVDSEDVILGPEIDLHERIKWINENYPKAKLVMEIHLNCSENEKAHGTEVLYNAIWNLKSRKYAKLFLKNICIKLWGTKKSDNCRGTKTCRTLKRTLSFLKHTKPPAIITESLFISNNKDSYYLVKGLGFENIVEAHIDTIKQILDGE